MISFSAVSKVYPDGTTAVHDLSLEIPAGRITVFVGPSGCGKTTSLRMINRMIEPTSGVITIDGTDTRQIDAPQLRRGIGYVIQNAGLFPHRTVADNIATVPVLQGVTRREARRRATELLERVGLPTSMARRYPAQLSGGQQQRVGVARALAADPPVMLMDEPFSAVDPVVREQLQTEFLRLQEELGKTIVFVTHDIDEAVRLGDRIAVFATGGHLAQYAVPADVLRRPADDFVAGFVGRDRGYRALSFAGATGLPVQREPTVRMGAAAPQGPGGGEHRWALVVDDDGRPRGWLDRDALSPGDPIGLQHLRLGGSLAAPGYSLRTALDAALSSPSGRGVAVDDAGVAIGTITLADVVAAIEATDRTALADPAGDDAGAWSPPVLAKGAERTVPAGDRGVPR
ncbi:ABC transporter ATP-binding protein [Nakamurella leprariae]|uniref:ABC-type quaternary amine transporter n=1 Tax=Nakamurella leprariae TaxID=2803911 RepID=A0A938Y8W8_9ACTN|nr:ATP-binding cassette domain-containing protein [Nakamurella leprariae]MBM9468196.1 ATP-binding cassette domain-containing protein [Nakamurella leprariae]